MCAAKSLKITNSYALLTTVKLFGKNKQRFGPLLDAERKNAITRHNKQFKRTDGKYDGLLMLCDL